MELPSLLHSSNSKSILQQNHARYHRLHDDYGLVVAIAIVVALATVVAFATVVEFASNQRRIFNLQMNQYEPKASQYSELQSIRYVKS